VEAGLSQAEASSMVADVRARPAIKERSRSDLVSRSHILYLPRGPGPVRTDRPPAALTWPEPEDLGRIVLRRFPDLVGLTLPFNLDHLDAGQAGGDGAPGPAAARSAGLEKAGAGCLERCETRYVFSARLERMLDVGDDGWLLLKPCNGRFPLGEILEAVGERNRETARTFYQRLAEAGVLTWDRL
jgi:hypothetical protein